MHPLTLVLLPEQYAVCRLPADATIDFSLFGFASGLCSVTRTKEELSIVCPAVDAPAGSQSELGWRTFYVQGPLDFALIGILASLSGVLAAEGIPIFVVSTFDTDYVLVREGMWERACQALTAAGHNVRQKD